MTGRPSDVVSGKQQVGKAAGRNNRIVRGGRGRWAMADGFIDWVVVFDRTRKL